MCIKIHIVFLMFFLYVCLLINCGRVKRVIGGIEVKCGTVPNVASLRNSSSLQHICGATIISRNFAVTAAHCVQSKKDEYILQFNNHCSEKDGATPKVVITEIITNDLYDSVTRAHDLALIRLTQKLPDQKNRLKRNILPISSFGISGECMLYGYGYKDVSTKKTSEILLSGLLKIVSLDQCQTVLGTSVAPKYNDGMLCAVGEGIDSCQGDSGSPLICAGATIEGISSYGMSCGVPGLPGVYTSIGAHLQWILNIIKDDGF